MPEAITEIQKRTNIPKELVYKVLWSYHQIVREAILNEVEVQFGDMGFFSWEEFKQRLNAYCRNLATGESKRADYPGHLKFKFRPTKKWKRELKEKTIKPIVREEGEENGVGK